MLQHLSRRLLRPALGVGLALLFAASAAPAQGTKVKSGEDLYKETLKATVWVVVPKGQPVGGVLKVSTGSGALVDRKQKIILTNYHVVGDSEQAVVFFPVFEKGKLVAERKFYQSLIPKGGGVRGKVVARDTRKDLALIQLETLPEGVHVLPLAKDSPSPGQRVHSVGNPGSSGALWVYTSGTVRQVYRKQWKAGDGTRIFELDAQVVETQSPTNKGDSGGPLVNDYGQLVAVTQGGSSDAQLLSVFIDVSEVKGLLASKKIKVSSGPAVVSTDKAKPDPDTPPKTPDEAERLEKLAQSRLNFARTFADQGKNEVARSYCSDIITRYPNTKAAAEAKQLIEKLKK